MSWYATPVVLSVNRILSTAIGTCTFDEVLSAVAVEELRTNCADSRNSVDKRGIEAQYEQQAQEEASHPWYVMKPS